MPLERGFRNLVDDAMERIRTISVDEAEAKLTDESVLFVDLRDLRELEREGVVPGAFHATRGMLEFWVDPASPYYKPVFGEGREMVLFCGGGWRSALAADTLQQMGFTTKEVCHIDGGFAAWKAAGKPTTTQAPKPPKGPTS
jgi:rhodanese-related sulfurtransferase